MVEATQQNLCIVLDEHSLLRQDLMISAWMFFQLEEPPDALGPENVPTGSATRKKEPGKNICDGGSGPVFKN